MREVNFGIADVSGLVALIEIQKATQTIQFSTHSADLIVGSTTWSPGPGATVTAIVVQGDGSFATADVTLMTQPGGIVEPNDGARGVLDDWPITISWVDPNSTSTVSAMLVGIIGSVAEIDRGIVTIAANGYLRLAQERPLTEFFSLTCRADLGDDHCKVPILANPENPAIEAFDIGRNQDYVRPDIATGLLAVSDAYGRIRTGSTVESYQNVYFECTTAGTTDVSAPSYNYSVGATTADGTAVFTARDAWTRAARGQAIDEFTIALEALPDARASDASWYVFGVLYVRSGALSGFRGFAIRAWDPSSLYVTLFLPIAVGDIPPNTQFEISPGCDFTRDMCFSRFDNIINLRAETFVPPPEMQFTPF